MPRKCLKSIMGWRCCVVFVGFIFLCTGLIGVVWFDELYRKMLREKLVMKYGNEAYDNWLKPPSGVYMKYYFFDYTNPEEIKMGAKPAVIQLGPYTYKGVVENIIVHQNENNITFQEKVTYYYDASASCDGCSELDVIHCPSATAVTLLDSIQKLNITKNSPPLKRLAMKALNFIFNSQNVLLFQRLTIKEILWGYNDPFLEFLKHEENKFGWILKALGWKLPPLPTTYIALQYNGTNLSSYIGNMTVLTGSRNIDDVQKYIGWRGLPYVPFWKNEYGRMLNGTDASRFHPFIKKSDKLYMFLNYYCRSLYITYNREETLKGIKLYKFQITADVLANASTNANNNAFCVDKCWPSGLIPVSKCLPGNPPVFMSFPHFYLGDTKLVDAIEGIQPRKDLHETVIGIEPITGLSMDSHQRLQINYLVKPIAFFDIVSNLHDKIFMPVLYLDSVSIIDDNNAALIRDKVLRPMIIIYYAKYVMVAVGSIMIILCLISYIVKKRKSLRYEKLNDVPKED